MPTCTAVLASFLLFFNVSPLCHWVHICRSLCTLDFLCCGQVHSDIKYMWMIFIHVQVQVVFYYFWWFWLIWMV